MTGGSLGDPSHREERVVKALCHRRGGDSWAAPGIFSLTVAVLPQTMGAEQLQPQTGHGEVLPAMADGQEDLEPGTAMYAPLGSHILVGVLGCCCL